jgi:hypothetical protein
MVNVIRNGHGDIVSDRKEIVEIKVTAGGMVATLYIDLEEAHLPLEEFISRGKRMIYSAKPQYATVEFDSKYDNKSAYVKHTVLDAHVRGEIHQPGQWSPKDESDYDSE